MTFTFRIGTKKHKIEAIEEVRELVVEQDNKERIKDMYSDIILQSDKVVTDVDELRGSINDIAAILEELSANSQETASASHEINESVTKVNAMVIDVAASLIDNLSSVAEISIRAEAMKNEAVESEASAVEMCTKFDNMLKQAMEKSKVIN